ncbi:MAG: GNAT family N-acetyltransferase [Pseudomonadota bacterium]
MQSTSEFTVRALHASDQAEWRALWHAYLAFYEATVSDAVYATTFGRLLGEDPYDPRAFVAEQDGKLIGLVHYFQHRHCWRVENVCYLQDLYAVPESRGTGVGRALIEAVYAAADALGTPSVYWMTQEHNSTARRLYDNVGQLTPFIKYQRPA